MAFPERLAWFLLVGLAIWLHGAGGYAHAEGSYAARVVQSETVQWNGASGVKYSTAVLAMASMYPAGYTFQLVSSTSTSATFRVFNATGSLMCSSCAVAGTLTTSSTYSCSYPDAPAVPGVEYVDGTGPVGSVCSCPTGTQVDGSQKVCVTQESGYCAGRAGQAPNFLSCTGAQCLYASSTYASAEAAQSCAQAEGEPYGCLVKGLRDSSFQYPDGTWWTSMSSVKYTGTKCQPGEGGTSMDKPGTLRDDTGKTVDPLTADAHKGQCPGTVNGVEVWKPCSWGVTQKTTTSAPTPTQDGGTQQTTTTEKTECKDGVCTNTTTSVVSSVSSTGTVTSTVTAGGGGSASKAAYCTENASDPLCGSTSWGGSCAAGFQCEGDAVMCAVARGTWLEKCALVDGPSGGTAETQAYAAAVAASGAASAGLDKGTVTVGPAMFDSSNALGVAGSCSLDKTVTVWGRSVVLPFSEVCGGLAAAGNVLLVVGFLLAVRIVGRG